MIQSRSDAEETPIPESVQHLLDQPINVKPQLLQHHAQMVCLLGGTILGEEVESLVAEHHNRDYPQGERSCRWDSNLGSI